MIEILPLVILVIFIIAIGIMQFIFKLQQRYYDDKQPRVLSKARIIQKKKNTTTRRTYYSFSKDGRFSLEYVVLFERLSDGKRIKYIIHEDEAKTLAEGDMGEIITQGSRYIGFCPEEKGDL